VIVQRDHAVNNVVWITIPIGLHLGCSSALMTRSVNMPVEQCRAVVFSKFARGRHGGRQNAGEERRR